METIIRPKSLTELVTEQLRNMIVSGEIDLGEHLSESRLARDLAVSRTPVREAINRLEMEGLLKVEPQRGTFVFCLEPDELAKLCDARVALETTALTAALSLAPDALVEALEGCARHMTQARAAQDVSAYLACDTEFHQLFFDLADNRFLNDAYQTISQKMAAVRNRLGRHPDHMDKSYREHLDIVEAARARDTARALDILVHHIGRKEGSYWSQATGQPEG